MFLCTCISLCFYQEWERKEEEVRIRTENLLRGNPLLNQQQNSSFKIKRRSGERSVHDRAFGWWCFLFPLRWDDNVVFKNCAKGEQRNKVPQTNLVLKYMLELLVNNIDACSHSANIDVITNNSLHMCTSTMAVVSGLCGERGLVTCKILVCAESVYYVRSCLMW